MRRGRANLVEVDLGEETHSPVPRDIELLPCPHALKSRKSLLKAKLETQFLCSQLKGPWALRIIRNPFLSKPDFLPNLGDSGLREAPVPW